MVLSHREDFIPEYTGRQIRDRGLVESGRIGCSLADVPELHLQCAGQSCDSGLFAGVVECIDVTGTAPCVVDRRIAGTVPPDQCGEGI